MLMTSSLIILGARRKAQRHRNAHLLIFSMNAHVKRFCPRPMVQSLKGNNSFPCIHIGANINAVLASIQQLRPITAKDNPEPPTHPNQCLLESHTVRENANGYDTSHRFIFFPYLV